MTPRDRATLRAILALDWTQPDPVHEWCKANPRQQQEQQPVQAKPAAKAKKQKSMLERGAA